MKRSVFLLCLWLAVSSSISLAELAPKRHVAPVSTKTAELLRQSMSLFDASYDPAAHLLRRPGRGIASNQTRYMVRESSWYALALLLRGSPSDTASALQIIGTVLDQQYLDPQGKWFGTFKRSPEEPLPHAGDLAFTTYDPNWRQFIGTTLEMILIEYPERIPENLQTRMYRAIDAAIQGEMQDGRLVPSYTNVALMYGSLWYFAALHDQNADWNRRANAWTEAVYDLFRQNGSFNEYNAPTYYGVDLYGLALWREYGATPRMRRLGEIMEAGLWKDLADFYQPKLRNLAGPFDRAYGMDMSRYVAVMGVWMRTVLDSVQAPLPENPNLTTDHVADMWFAPQIAILGTRIPQPALRKLRTFPGPHLVNRRIDSQRVATAWIEDSAMWGGESTSLTKDTGTSQFHPVTVHWRMPSGEIGWIRMTRSPMIDAVADRTGVTIKTQGDVSFQIFAGASPNGIEAAAWSLPGLTVTIQSDTKGFTRKRSTDCGDCVDVSYRAISSMQLKIDLPHGQRSQTNQAAAHASLF